MSALSFITRPKCENNNNNKSLLSSNKGKIPFKNSSALKKKHTEAQSNKNLNVCPKKIELSLYLSIETACLSDQKVKAKNKKMNKNI